MEVRKLRFGRVEPEADLRQQPLSARRSAFMTSIGSPDTLMSSKKPCTCTVCLLADLGQHIAQVEAEENGRQRIALPDPVGR